MALAYKGRPAHGFANLSVADNITFIYRKVELAGGRVHGTAGHAGRVKAVVHALNHGVEAVLAGSNEGVPHAAHGSILVAFTAGRTRTGHTYFGSTHAVAHVTFQNSVFNQYSALGRHALVVKLEATPHAVQSSVVNGGKARLADSLAQLAAEGACISADRFRF